MLKLITIPLFLLLTFLSFGQDQSEQAEQPKPLLFGFQAGIESVFFTGKVAPSDTALASFLDASVSPGIGASFGFSLFVNLKKNVAFRPGLIMAMTPGSVTYRTSPINTETQSLYKLSSEVNLHVMFPNSLANNKLSVFAGPSVIFNVPVLSDNRPTESSYYPRADLGISYPVRIGMGKYLLDLVYGFGVTSVIQGDLPMDQWYDSLHRQTLALRLHLY